VTRGLIISAPASGTGKTTLTLGLLTALRAKGIVVQPFKCGPDYIDPTFHSAAARRASFNLDSWAMPPMSLRAVAGQASGADLSVAEGAMGLFDGVANAGETGNGASADIAALMGWPVVLVLNVAGQAQSAAATALGFSQMRPDVRVAGVVLNNVASPRHEALVRHGMNQVGIRVFGALPKRPEITLPERHLGLVQAIENPNLTAHLTRLGDFIAAHLDLEALLEAADQSPFISSPETVVTLPPPGMRIALAKDEAFSFIYPHLLQAWYRAGATILPFSPLTDEGPDPSADCAWLPGGYPELHAGRLASAQNFRKKLLLFGQIKPVHGECGGYMALGAALLDKAGVSHPMVGLLGLVTSYQNRKMHLGYRRAQLLRNAAGLQTGQILRGHEFHYSTVISQPDAPLANVYDATGEPTPETGSVRGHVTGSYFHMIGPAAS
jgi:cobyrinic acid a,c-diamide synthase